MRLPVTFGYGQGGVLANVRTNICCALFDSQDDEAADHGDFDSAEDAEGHCTYEGVAVGEVLLEGIDGEEGEIWFLLCVAEEVDVDELADLEVLRGDVLDDLGKIF